MRIFLLFCICSLFILSQAVGFAPGIYCGYENCYDVIGIDRGNFTKAELSKLYRKLARLYHPDRVKDKSKLEEAEVKFRLIATAYETLKDDETRGYYDYYLDHPEERYYNYYQYYRMRAAPKVDIRLVILATIIIISVVQYISATQKFSEAISYASSQVKFRNAAIEVARERKLLEFDEKGKPKKKQKDGTDVEKVIQSIIVENINISGGYKPASLKDTFAFQIIVFPVTFKNFLVQRLRLAYRQYSNKELTHEDKLFLIRKNLGLSTEQFKALDDAEIDGYLRDELWKEDACAKYKKQKELEEKEKLMNSGKYKQYKRFMKRNAGNTISFLEE
uniref:J domain-containing protein n=1 Tax=Panagrolaimus sp. JU765 TaxID=591449 RepID=A0AC34RA04_9BILA